MYCMYNACSYDDGSVVTTSVHQTTLAINFFAVSELLCISLLQTNPRCRDSQLFEILQFVEQTRGADPVILVGDFNTKPRHLAYSLLTRCLGLTDVFSEDPVDTCDLVNNIFILLPSFLSDKCCPRW